MQKLSYLFFATLTSLLVGCADVKLNFFPDATRPLQECTLSGSGWDKVAVIPVSGFITDVPDNGFVYNKPSLVQEVVSQLKMAEEDSSVRAVLLKINSPGGSTTASDILYQEIVNFKKRSGKPVVVCMMDMAASGGYYIALPADYIVAHPTTVTGSVGVILMQPKLHGLMDKIGVTVDVSKSGTNKDMGSPFRKRTAAETKLFDDLIAKLGQTFMNKVLAHRKLTPEAIAQAKTAQILLAKDAKELNLIDDIGYLEDAVAKAKELADISVRSRTIIYRRRSYPNDNIYNNITSHSPDAPTLIKLGMMNKMLNMPAGFYFLWLPGQDSR